MIDAFIQHIKDKSLLDPNKTYLLGCSGGLDSICLAHLLLEASIFFEIAHVNFKLRGKESDGDEIFVSKWSKNHGILFHYLHEDTLKLAEEKQISIQMAAREIRYDFFSKLCRKRNLDGIVVAHHEDDQIETIFLNLIRGTGLEGLSGMADRRGDLIRPLLPFSRKSLEEWAKKNKIQWREDSSNQKEDYLRNYLRHSVLPPLFKSKEEAKSNLLNSFERIKDSGKAFGSLFEDWKKSNIIEEDEIQSLAFKSFIKTPGASSLLFYWLRPFGFNSEQTRQILISCKAGDAGKKFYSPNYQLNIDRDHLFLGKKNEAFSPIFLEEDSRFFSLRDTKYEIVKTKKGAVLDRKLENAMIDFERLTFPLEIRTWQQGDKFIPLGMSHSKKISDFLIDEKVPLIKKEAVKVVLSADKIIWVIGLRMADWVKTTASTREIFYIKLVKS